MEMRVAIAGRDYRVRLKAAVSLAIPLDFAGPQPGFFGAPRASAAPLRRSGFVGATAEGGSCNVAELRLVPHCNGTHIETVGHILDDPVPVAEVLVGGLGPARLVTLAPEGPAGEGLLTRAALAGALDAVHAEELTALIVRTLPNGPAKRACVYGDDCPPPYFSSEAMHYLVERGVVHLLVDFPSIDRMHDKGMSNHRLFWNVPPGSRRLGRAVWSWKTVTEMIFVPDEVPDGLYLLDLAAPAFLSDAAPCRPLIYPLAALKRARRDTPLCPTG
jgi:kynurenine formamidase